MQGIKRMETHNYRMSREDRIEVTLWVGAYGLCIIVRDSAVPDEVHNRGIPILLRLQARHNTKLSQMAYSEE